MNSHCGVPRPAAASRYIVRFISHHVTGRPTTRVVSLYRAVSFDRHSASEISEDRIYRRTLGYNTGFNKIPISEKTATDFLRRGTIGGFELEV